MGQGNWREAPLAPGRLRGQQRADVRQAAVGYGYPPGAVAVLVIELHGPQVVATTLARMGEPMPVVHIVQLLDASVQGVPVQGVPVPPPS